MRTDSPTLPLWGPWSCTVGEAPWTVRRHQLSCTFEVPLSCSHYGCTCWVARLRYVGASVSGTEHPTTRTGHRLKVYGKSGQVETASRKVDARAEVRGGWGAVL